MRYRKQAAASADLFLDERKIDAELLEDLEERLLLADVGVETTFEIIEELTDQLKHAKLADGTWVICGITRYFD